MRNAEWNNAECGMEPRSPNPQFARSWGRCGVIDFFRLPLLAQGLAHAEWLGVHAVATLDRDWLRAQSISRLHDSLLGPFMAILCYTEA